MKIARRRRKIFRFLDTKNTILLRESNISEVQNPKIFACGELFSPPYGGEMKIISPPTPQIMGGKINVFSPPTPQIMGGK